MISFNMFKRLNEKNTPPVETTWTPPETRIAIATLKSGVKEYYPETKYCGEWWSISGFLQGQTSKNNLPKGTLAYSQACIDQWLKASRAKWERQVVQKEVIKYP